MKQTKNLWHRTLTTQLILKHCNIIGLNLIEVNPIYSSFIGNMIYHYFDPISSSLEIGRRGATKYTKGSSVYPLLSGINQEKLDYLLGENISKISDCTKYRYSLWRIWDKEKPIFTFIGLNPSGIVPKTSVVEEGNPVIYP